MLIRTLVLMALVAPTPALAWQQAEVESGLLLFQQQGCVHWTVSETGSDDFEDFEVLRDAVASGFEVWNTPACSSFRFIDSGDSSCTEPHVVDSGTQATLVVWYEDSWPFVSPLGNPFAATGVWYEPSTGRILDADIAMNGLEYTWGTEGAPEEVDVQSIVAHEAGHVLGLGESSVLEATMYGFASEGETTKRDLHADDIEAVCTLYPPGTTQECPSAPGAAAYCIDTGGCGGCGLAQHRRSAEPLAALIALVVLLLALVATRPDARRWRSSRCRSVMANDDRADSDQS